MSKDEKYKKSIELLNCDYLICTTCGVVVDEDNITHHNNCVITPEWFVIKNTQHSHKEWIPQNVIDKCGIKIYKEVNERPKRRTTLPTGAKILMEGIP